MSPLIGWLIFGAILLGILYGMFKGMTDGSDSRFSDSSSFDDGGVHGPGDSGGGF